MGSNPLPINKPDTFSSRRRDQYEDWRLLQVLASNFRLALDRNEFEMWRMG